MLQQLFTLFALVCAVAIIVTLAQLWWRATQRIDKLEVELRAAVAQFKRTAPSELSERLDALEQHVGKMQTNWQSFAGKVWARFTALGPPAPKEPKKLDRDELRRQHLPKVTP